MAVPPALRVELLGGFRVLAGVSPSARLPSSRQQQLLAFLVLHARAGPIPRLRLAGSLWPESSDAQALTNLRRELHHLREAWPGLEAAVDAGSRTLAWSADAGVTVDLVEFEAAADRGLAGDPAALHEAARLYQGDILPDAAGEWIDAHRERLRLRATAVLARVVEVLEQDRAFGEAIDYARQSLRLDPLDERAWCALMRCHARRGERAAALHLYQECAALLKKELGVQPSAATRATYREILDLDAEGAVIPAPLRKVSYPLVGRDREWHCLLDAWHAAAAGRPQLFLVRGEAGIGKSRLAEELAGWCDARGVGTVTARCYAGEGRLAYAPIAAWLKGDALRAPLARLDAAWLTEVARLRPEILAARPGVSAPGEPVEPWQRVRFFEALAHAFRSATPLVLVLDDLQWVDADTVEWLQYFVCSEPGMRCLVVGTLRTEEEQDNPQLGRFVERLQREGLLTAIALGPLDQAGTAALASEVAEQPLDEAALARAFLETEGHPLFIVERGRMELSRRSGAVAEDALPRVQSVVAARLALLSPEARAAAEVASAVGRDFQFDLLAHACDLEEDALVRAVDELWRRQIVRVQADERWDFSHDRLREVAYGGIGPARRRLVHRRIAQGMELLFANRLDEVSASIAVHLERGGQPARAIPFLERAAAFAASVSAHEEAIHCLDRALSLLHAVTDGRERDERELALRSSLSVALNSARGYAAAEVERNLDRVFTLSRGRGEVPGRWLWAAFSLRYVLGEMKPAREFAELALARTVTDPTCGCEAHHAMGAVLLSVGDLDGSRRHFEAALAAYDERRPQRSALGSDFGVFVHAWYAHTLWLLGDESLALSHTGQAASLARRLEHPYNQALALSYAGLLHQMRRDVGRVRDCAEGVLALCRRYGFGYYGHWAQVLQGWAVGLEQPAEGARLVEAALAGLDLDRAHARRSYYLSLLAEVYTQLGNPDRAASLVDHAINIALEHSEVWWLPALYLQKSQLGRPPGRDAVMRQGLELARAQRSRCLEQRILSAMPSAT